MMATSSVQPLELKYQQPATTVSHPDTFVCSVQVDRSFVGFVEGHNSESQQGSGTSKYYYFIALHPFFVFMEFD